MYIHALLDMHVFDCVAGKLITKLQKTHKHHIIHRTAAYNSVLLGIKLTFTIREYKGVESGPRLFFGKLKYLVGSILSC